MLSTTKWRWFKPKRKKEFANAIPTVKSIIRTENLGKTFGTVRAVNDVSLNIGRGEIYGFLGLNGAGKTTTIRMLLGMVRPTSGNVWIEGKRIGPGCSETWKHVGYLVESPSCYPDLTVRENLEAERRLRLVSDAAAVDRVADLLKLNQYFDRKARHLSLGNLQRLGLAKALLHDPEILILDEPTNGLDPAGITEIRLLLVEFAHDKGVTVFISSHILGEIAKLADRIGIIHEGNLVAETSVDKLDSQLRRRLFIDTRDNTAAGRLLAKLGYAVSVTGSGKLELTDEKALADVEMISTRLVQEGCPPVLLVPEQEDLESYFLRTIGTKGDGL